MNNYAKILIISFDSKFKNRSFVVFWYSIE